MATLHRKEETIEIDLQFLVGGAENAHFQQVSVRIRPASVWQYLWILVLVMVITVRGYLLRIKSF